MSLSQPSEPPLPRPLLSRTCFHCRKSPGRDTQLKRCAGCAQVAYCSKECQKAAWPKHKERCMHMATYTKNMGSQFQQSEARRYGYKDTVDFGQGLTEFIEANYWAFQLFSRALAMSEEGIADDTNSPTKNLKIALQCAKDSRTLNPACRFVMCDHSWISLDEIKSDAELSMHADLRDHSAPLRRDVLKRHGENPLFKGLAMLLFHVRPINVSLVYYYPRFHPDSRTPLEMLSRSGVNVRSIKRALADDILALTKASINADMALQCPQDDWWREPLPGRYIRKGKAWVWEASFSDWKTFLEGGHTCKEVDLLKDALSQLTSGFPIPVLFLAAQRTLE